MLLNAASVPGQRTLISAASELFLSYFKLAARDIGDLSKAFEVIEEARGRIAADSLRLLSLLLPRADTYETT